MTDAVWSGPPPKDATARPCDACGTPTPRHYIAAVTTRPGTIRLVGVVRYECLPCECRRQIARLTELRAGRTADHPGNKALDEALDYWQQTLDQEQVVGGQVAVAASGAIAEPLAAQQAQDGKLRRERTEASRSGGVSTARTTDNDLPPAA